MSKRTDEAQTFKTELGSKAIVQREDVPGDAAELGGVILRKLGGELFAEQIASAGFEYSGSFACHIFVAPLTRTMQFITQETTLDNTPQDVANAAFRDCEAAVKKYYGMKSSKMRSGAY